MRFCLEKDVARRKGKIDMRRSPSLMRFIFGLVIIIVAPADLRGEEPVGTYNFEFVAAPMVVSNPNFGNGGGATLMGLFDLAPKDENVQSSSLGLTGLYTDRGSHLLALGGNLLPNDRWRIKTAVADIGVKSELNVDELPERADFTTTVRAFHLNVLHRFGEHFFVGMRGVVKDIGYSPDNESGNQYLEAVNATDNLSASLGPVFSYDTRDNRFFPYEGVYAEAALMTNPTQLGNDESYGVLDGFINGYNQYRPGHVIAWRAYGRFTPSDTPYSDLSTLGRKADLRGYIAGENIAQHLISTQVEYRWQWRPKWAVVGFVGEAVLFDPGDLSRDSFYSSAGTGLRYLLSEERRLNFRVDYAVGEDYSDGLYVGISEAF